MKPYVHHVRQFQIHLHRGVWLWSFVPSSQKWIASQNCQVEISKLHLSHCFQWLLLAATMVENSLETSSATSSQVWWWSPATKMDRANAVVIRIHCTLCDVIVQFVLFNIHAKSCSAIFNGRYIRPKKNKLFVCPHKLTKLKGRVVVFCFCFCLYFF